MYGKLFIVATPIGNLSDITFRAVDVLKKVSLVLSEDTRETYKVLNKYNILTPQISYRDQNHERIIENIIERLKQGQDLALVSDSGTPLVSDPGFKLIERLVKENIEIVSIPGPSAVISSLVVSGMPTDKFTFLGFLPKTAGKRDKTLKEYGSLDSTLIIFESPFRVNKLLQEIYKNLGDRYVCVVNEQTKVFERLTRGRVTGILDGFSKPRGEFVILVAKAQYQAQNG